MRALAETERNAVRRALIEERSRYCVFVSALRPFLDEEIALVAEFQQLEEVNKRLAKNAEEPFKLPPASEQVLNDIRANGGDSAFAFRTPPSSPSSLGSRKSSMCSISSAGSASSLHHSPSHFGSQTTLGGQSQTAGSVSSAGGASAQNAAQLRHRSLSQVRSLLSVSNVGLNALNC